VIITLLIVPGFPPHGTVSTCPDQETGHDEYASCPPISVVR